MSDNNIRIVQSYFDAVSKGEIDKLDDLLSETLTWHQPGASDLSGEYRGRPAVYGLIGKFMERSRGTFKFDRVGKLLANGEFVAVSLHFSAQDADRSMSMEGIDLLRIEDGKIEEVWLFSEDQTAEDLFWSHALS